MTLNLSQGRADTMAPVGENSADRTTHLKIVVVGLCAALLIAVVGVSANVSADLMTAQSPTVLKAGAPVVFTDRNGSTIR
jgi:hypothetical protein